MSTATNRRWKIRYDIPEFSAELERAGYNPLLSLVMANSGFTSLKEAQDFLSTGTELIHDPMLMSGMCEAVERINLAIERHEKIAVYGDYDVDGITSTCLLSDYLNYRGLDCISYIPNRNDEGYGLNCSALDSFKAQGISLVITVDCGITAVEEAEYASQLGIDMIITDHHECKGSELPQVSALIDCKQPGDSYPNKNLAGVGVAFKLACACEGGCEDILERYADLVSVGTIADVMPLVDENRVLVRIGLEKLRNSPRPGILAMLREAGLEPKNLSATSVGYTIAPRLNAAGRLGDVKVSQALLMSENEGEARSLAEQLSELNRKRQSIEIEIWNQALKKMEGKIPIGPIVLYHDDWNQGVIGIAASRLAEQYSVPTIMISINEDGIGKGSCRSYGGFNLFEALSACSEHLISYGGHALAAGLNIEKDKVDDFRTALEEYYSINRPDDEFEQDCGFIVTDVSVLSTENVRSLRLLEPFGNSNPRPLMCITGATLESFQNVGNGKHLKMKLSSGGKDFDAIFFSHTSEEYGLKPGDMIDIAFTPQINEFRGAESVQFSVSALRKYDSSLCSDILESKFLEIGKERVFCPERADFIKIWKSWKSSKSDTTLGRSTESIIRNCPKDMSPERYCLCLMVFKAAGLISGNGESVFGSRPSFGHEKTDLEQTELLKWLRRKDG